MEPSSPLTPSYIPEPERAHTCRTASLVHYSLIPAPQVTANAWSIVNSDTGEVLWSKNGESSNDIASLTKMMTCYVVYQCIKDGLCTEDDIVNVPKESTILGGTTANLRAGDRLRLIDLLHGMMLPSGNDAAYTLAEHCGKLMRESSKSKNGSKNVNYFVKQMNSISRMFGLKYTKFLNPHGLSHLGNQSTANEMGKLGSILIKVPSIANIVRQIKYTCEISNASTRKTTWINTNILLRKEEVTGLKTGQNTTAGPCLCVSYEICGFKLIITLLKTRSPEKRWEESARLVSWAVNQLGIIHQRIADNNIRVKNLSSLIKSIDYCMP